MGSQGPPPMSQGPPPMSESSEAACQQDDDMEMPPMNQDIPSDCGSECPSMPPMS